LISTDTSLVKCGRLKARWPIPNFDMVGELPRTLLPRAAAWTQSAVTVFSTVNPLSEIPAKRSPCIGGSTQAIDPVRSMHRKRDLPGILRAAFRCITDVILAD
jgi:hypothetical protein